MKLPIIAYGDPILRKIATPITSEYVGLSELIDNMFETMYHSSGVGLAAPQIGLSIRLFVIDTFPAAEDKEESKEAGIKKIFINPRMIKEYGNNWTFTEGCLSIPGVREDVRRDDTIELEYQDENFATHQSVFTGFAARVIQHEYDHLEGILFIDKINSLKKALIKSKLMKISKGDVRVDYKMRFPLKKR